MNALVPVNTAPAMTVSDVERVAKLIELGRRSLARYEGQALEGLRIETRPPVDDHGTASGFGSGEAGGLEQAVSI